MRTIYSIRETDAAATGKWQDGMVLGNGRTGVVCSGAPVKDSYVFQNMDFVIPRDQPRFTPPEVSAQLEEARQAVINLDDSWDVHDRQRTEMYCFHPGAKLMMQFPEQEIKADSYGCVLDDATGELSVRYENEDGKWERKTFVSRCDDVVVTKLCASDKQVRVKVEFLIEDVAHMPKFGRNKKGITSECFMKYRTFEGENHAYIGLIGHYPDYDGSEMQESGYLTISRIYVKHDYEEVLVLTKTACLRNLGSVADFDTFDETELVQTYLKRLDEIAEKYRDEQEFVSYENMLKPHSVLHATLFEAAALQLGRDASKEEEAQSNEELIKKQKTESKLLDEMAMRVYAQGREAMIACSGYSAPRLCGLWTGEWNPGWNGAYTMDANVNIQVAGMNTAHVYDAALGYIYFVLKQIPDWEKNAADVYGMKDAIQIPVNTDGRRAMLVEYDKRYLFQYWNAGASWMMVPIYEFWQCYGNRQIPMIEEIGHLNRKKEAQNFLDLEEDILRPLLRKAMRFWQQLCTPEYYMDAAGTPHYEKGKSSLKSGETYMLVPAYSPENIPKDYNSTVTANAAMDISAARDCLNMVMTLERKCPVEDSQETVEACRELKAHLPSYQFDETNGLREWSYPYFKDNHEHRHISHLYLAWPAYEAQENLNLRNACKQAIVNRNRKNQGIDDTASHGWIHKALVAARLKDGAMVEEILLTLFRSDIFYNSFMTDHNTNRAREVYCTDTIMGLVGVIDEALLFSNDGVIELLPALPPVWSCGQITGLMARTRACVDVMDWNLKYCDEGQICGKVTAIIHSQETQELIVTCPLLSQGVIILHRDHSEQQERVNEGDAVKLAAGETIRMTFEL